MVARTVQFLVFALWAMLAVFPGTAHPDVVTGQDIVVESGRTMDEAVSLWGSVIVNGDVTDAVSIGGSVIVRGTVNDVVAVGRGIVIEPGGRVTGDAVSVGGNIDVRDSAFVNGDVVTVGGRLLVAPTGSVDGERVNVGGISWEKMGDVRDGIIRVLMFGPFAGVMGGFGAFILLFFTLARMLVWLAVAVLSYHLLPRNVEAMAGALRFRFGASVLTGLLTMVLLPFLFLVLLISLLGIPLMPLAMVVVFLAYLFGSAGVALWAGRLLPGSAERSGMRNVVLGVVTVSLLRLIPGIGFILWIFMACASFGIAVITRLGERPLTNPA